MKPTGDLTFPDWQEQELDVHSLIGDPLFVDRNKGDFSLKLGFHAIDLSTVGPRKAD
jgi:hypothetical protein